MARVVNVHEAKARLSELLERTKAGEEILIAKRGKPYAKLVPVEPERVPLGFLRFHVPDSFFEPLSEEELEAWEGNRP
jgi:prevent-host-death family protein